MAVLYNEKANGKNYSSDHQWWKNFSNLCDRQAHDNGNDPTYDHGSENRIHVFRLGRNGRHRRHIGKADSDDHRKA